MRRECMTKLFAICLIAVLSNFTIQGSAQDKQALRLVQTIPLPGVTGRLDHMGVDLDGKRLFVAAVSNNTLEVVDLVSLATWLGPLAAVCFGPPCGTLRLGCSVLLERSPKGGAEA